MAYGAPSAKYPDDDEARIFSAVYLAATQDLSDQSYEMYLRAVKVLEENNATDDSADIRRIGVPLLAVRPGFSEKVFSEASWTCVSGREGRRRRIRAVDAEIMERTLAGAVMRSASVLLLIGIAVVSPHGQERRPMVVEDLFNIETLADVRLSPDGSTLAVVIQRAWSNPETYRPYPMFGNDQADLWIVPVAAGAPRNITHGAKDGTGYWSPLWSPDGERLALLSTAGNDNVRPYIWEKRSGRLTRVSQRGVDTRTRMNATGDATAMEWVDQNHLLATVLPVGEQPFSFRLRRQTRQIASDAWEKLARGHEPTTSILEGGIDLAPPRPDQLLLIDAATMRTDILVEGSIRQVLVSPTRDRAAVIMQGRPPVPRPGSLLGSVDAPSRLAIVTLRDGPIVTWVESAFNPVVEFGTIRHRWSPDGESLAILGTANAQPDSPRAAFVVSASGDSVRRVATGFDVSAFAWSGSGYLLVRATAPQTGRSDWWNLQSPGTPANLTAAQSVSPTQLMRTRFANEMIGLSDGTLWRFDVNSGERRLVDISGKRLANVLWPRAESRAIDVAGSLIARTDDGQVIRVDPWGPPVTTFSIPPKATTVSAYDPQRKLVIASAPDNPDGTFLWTGAEGTSNFVRRLALNEQLAHITSGTQQLIEYHSTTGQPLKGILFLPPDYQPGSKYPLVTWVYPDTIIRDVESETNWSIKNHAHPDNLHVLAGHGYAVLIPSMPPSNDRGLGELSIGVMPAIDRVVEMGIADPNRIGLVGQSGGGAVTYGLITQTDRFKAAVAMNGFADRISAYGTFSGESRYTDYFDDKFAPWGEAPWKDPDGALKHSAIAFLDRVHTPLLILHGDIDYIPIQQAEEVFTSLARMGKRVRFVRYWGESHGVTDSPANVRDRWRQIFKWFDTYLLAPNDAR